MKFYWEKKCAGKKTRHTYTWKKQEKENNVVFLLTAPEMHKCNWGPYITLSPRYKRTSCFLTINGISPLLVTDTEWAAIGENSDAPYSMSLN